MKEPILMADARVAAVPVEECGEELADARESLLIDDRHRPVSAVFSQVRRGVLARLREAEEQLPDGLRLLIVEGHRSLAMQHLYFDEYAAELKQLHPEWTPQELIMATSRLVAPPEIAPHGTGGAVDLTLATSDGVELDMGTPIDATPEETDGGCYTAAENIPAEARHYRDLLSKALTDAGFANYPTEWWHWSYGDRYWALTQNRPHAMYGLRT